MCLQGLENYSSLKASSRVFLNAGKATIKTSRAAAINKPPDSGLVKNTV